MDRAERHTLIREIEEMRNSKLLVYITGDRRGMETRIAADAVPFLFRHLSRIGKQTRIDLYIYTTGGITMAGYGIVNLIREFCDEFGVIIPYKAFSCGTLIALGANEVIMTKLGQLSPIDPSLDHPLCPTIPVPGRPGVTTRVPVNVEDLMSYLELAREAGLKNENSIAKVFEKLSEAVNPLTLGAANRLRGQIAFLARTLLSYHMNDEDRIKKIIDNITKGRFSHNYLIGRKEAKTVLGLPLVDVQPELEEKIIRLYEGYAELLSLNIPYHPELVLGSQNIAVGTFNRGIIETIGYTHVFRTRREVKRVELRPPQVPSPTIGYLERELGSAWVEDQTI